MLISDEVIANEVIIKSSSYILGIFGSTTSNFNSYREAAIIARLSINQSHRRTSHTLEQFHSFFIKSPTVILTA